MSKAITFDCDTHADEYACPDSLVQYSPRFDEYGLIVHDGGTSSIVISHCPWCGIKLRESKRARWFNELEAKGIEEPSGETAPPEYLSDTWWRKL